LQTPHDETPEDPELLELVTAAQAGDRSARDQLLEGHLKDLTVFVRTRLGRALRSRETSQDLAQSVCREALRDLGGFEYRGEASFRRWLFHRAENKIKDRVRFWQREKRSTAREEALPSGDHELDPGTYSDLASFCTPSRHAASREELERVGAAFATLSPEYREVILLTRVAGLSHAEVAREMGRTPIATRTLLSRALARLATALED